uniref:Uncharacterized protein n=1 Tax=Oryza punctata TaxID=4537 RepID=A0A0E0LZJ2_ORYPU
MPSEQELTIQGFMKDTKLTRVQLLGLEPIEIATKADLKHTYTFSEPLVKPEQVNSLSIQMYRLHQWYMERSAIGREMFGVRVKDMDHSNGEDTMWIRFEDIFDVYQLDALDVSLLNCWVLAWARFSTTVCLVFKEELDVRKDFRILWMTEQLSHMNFIKVVQKQLMGFSMHEIVNPTGEFHDDGKPIRQPHRTS